MRSSTTDNTAFETHLYSVTLDDGIRLTAIEEAIAAIETKAAPLVDKLVRDQSLVGQERADFSSFLAIMRVRTNSVRRQYAEAMVGLRQRLMHMTASEPLTFNSYIGKYEAEHGALPADRKADLREAMLNPSGYVAEVDREATLRVLCLHDDLAPLFYDMNWTLLSVPAGRYLITSDNPMSQLVPASTGLRGHGMRDIEVEITMPLSPSVCWMGHWRKDIPKAERMSVEGTKVLNRLRAFFAERFLFADRCDAGIQSLARKYRNDKPRTHVGPIGNTKLMPFVLRRPGVRGGLQ